eukprot:scaffold216_cov375-Pavlova_lutheri.AAC.2
MDAKKESTETPLVRVPYEALKRSVRDESKALQEQLATITKEVEMLQHGHRDREVVIGDLDAASDRIQNVKRKLQDREKAEKRLLNSCYTRLDYLSKPSTPEKVEEFERERLDRILIDYLLRESLKESGMAVVRSTELEGLVDVDIFLETQRIASTLKQGDCRSALAWCAQNAGRLKKLRSSLEFNLRVQEFVEYVRSGRLLDAVQYARTYLGPWSSVYSKQFYEAMGVLVFGPQTKCERYRQYFAPARWDDLAGLSVLNSHRDSTEEVNIEDPMQLKQFQTLAAGLPRAKHLHSKIRCWLTKEVMTDENPPLLLPNGMVYSRKGLETMALANAGWITCPRTGYRCKLEQAERLYIS